LARYNNCELRVIAKNDHALKVKIQYLKTNKNLYILTHEKYQQKVSKVIGRMTNPILCIRDKLRPRARPFDFLRYDVQISQQCFDVVVSGSTSKPEIYIRREE
jgi:hypothetical protein